MLINKYYFNKWLFKFVWHILGETFSNRQCTEQCTCGDNGKIKCSNYQCGAKELCQMINNRATCVPQS